MYLSDLLSLSLEYWCSDTKKNCQLFVCSIVALVCAFYKRPLKHS